MQLAKLDFFNNLNLTKRLSSVRHSTVVVVHRCAYVWLMLSEETGLQAASAYPLKWELGLVGAWRFSMQSDRVELASLCRKALDNLLGCWQHGEAVIAELPPKLTDCLVSCLGSYQGAFEHGSTFALLPFARRLDSGLSVGAHPLCCASMDEDLPVSETTTYVETCALVGG